MYQIYHKTFEMVQGGNMLKHSTGLWKNIKTLQDLGDYDFCDGLDAIEMNASSLLHGYCSVFAYQLAKKYGYPIYLVSNIETGEKVHYFCWYRGLLVDVRGIIDNLSLFMNEFADFVDMDNEFGNGNIEAIDFKYLESVVKSEYPVELFDCVRNFINKHANWYKITN